MGKLAANETMRHEQIKTILDLRDHYIRVYHHDANRSRQSTIMALRTLGWSNYEATEAVDLAIEVEDQRFVAKFPDHGPKFPDHNSHLRVIGPNFTCDSDCCYERYTAMHGGNPPFTFEQWQHINI